MIKKFKPVLLRNKEVISITNDINKVIKENIFQPLCDIYKSEFHTDLKLNDVNVILEALKSNQIYFENGYIRGKLNSKIVKELQRLGAEHVIGLGWKFNTLPYQLAAIVGMAQLEANSFVNKLDEFLNTINIDSLVDKMNLSFEGIIKNANEQLATNLKDIITKPELDDYTNQDINEKYIYNLKLDIKNWLPSEIINMRKKMKDYVLNYGYSQKKIADILKNDYSLTQKKANFLARQESSLLLSNYTTSKYIQYGFEEFIWQTLRDSRVRDTHKKLDGHIYRFDDPPVVDKKGKRALPGQDYGCRCVAIPIIRHNKWKEWRKAA